MDKTLLKGLTLLETLIDAPAPRGVAELARELGWSRSNIHRTLRTLLECGYVVAEDGRYSVSLKVWSLGCRVIGRLDVREIAAPHLQALSKATSEGVHLSVFDNGEVVYVEKIESSHPIRVHSEVGSRAPAYCVGTGKALLAFQSAEVIDRIAAHLEPHTARTITDPEALKCQLREIQASGYAVNLGEWHDNVCCVGAPIRGARGTVIAALGLSGPASRFDGRSLDRLIPVLCETAAKISMEMGYGAGEAWAG